MFHLHRRDHRDRGIGCLISWRNRYCGDAMADTCGRALTGGRRVVDRAPISEAVNSRAIRAMHPWSPSDNDDLSLSPRRMILHITPLRSLPMQGRTTRPCKAYSGLLPAALGSKASPELHCATPDADPSVPVQRGNDRRPPRLAQARLLTVGSKVYSVASGQPSMIAWLSEQVSAMTRLLQHNARSQF